MIQEFNYLKELNVMGKSEYVTSVKHLLKGQIRWVLLLKFSYLEELTRMVPGGNVMWNQHSTMQKKPKQNKGRGRKAQSYSLLSLRCVTISGKSLHLSELQLLHL